jgi:hypothetical protein
MHKTVEGYAGKLPLTITCSHPRMLSRAPILMERRMSGLEDVQERRTSGRGRPAEVAPSRVGKVTIAAYFEPSVRQQLAILAAKRSTSQTALIAEALNLMFERYGEPPIAGA